MIQKIKDTILEMKKESDIVSSETNEQKIDKVLAKLEQMTMLWSLNSKTIFRNFVHGIATALGATLGLAIVLGILGLMIRAGGGLPLIGSWISQLGQYIK